MAPSILLAAIEQALNGYLSLDPEAVAALGPMHGKCIGIDLAGVDMQLYLVPGPAGILVLERYEGEPDCVLRGTPLGLARLSVTVEKADEMFGRMVEIRGDTALAQRFGTVLGNLQIDWEELLSGITGDVVAHTIGRGVRDFLRWGSNVRESLTTDCREYLQEESRVLPTRIEVEEFLGDVDQVRDDVERLAARVERLRRAELRKKGWDKM